MDSFISQTDKSAKEKNACLFPCLFSLKQKKSTFYSQEPSNKRVRPLAKVSSLVNLISPSKNGAVRRFGQTIQVSSVLIRSSKNKNVVSLIVTFFILLFFC